MPATSPGTQPTKRQLRTLVHQLRNPLAALRTYAQLLLRRLEADSSHRPLVEGMLSDNANSASTSTCSMASGTTSPQQDPLAHPVAPGPAEGEATMQTLLMPLLERAEATASLQGRPWRADRGPSGLINRPRTERSRRSSPTSLKMPSATAQRAAPWA